MLSGKPLVAVVVHSLECGGVERITVNMLQHLASRGHRADILLRVAAGEFLTELPPGVRVVELGRSAAQALFRLAGYLRREQPLNLLSLMYPQNELALLAKALSGTRVRTLISVRSMLSGQREIVAFRLSCLRRLHAGWVRFLARHSYPLADRIMTVSDGAARDICELTRLPASRITVIRNPVLRPQLYKRAGEPPSHPWFAANQPPVILGVGRLHPIKDFATLVEAFAIVRAQKPARLLILGDGPEKSRLRRLAEARGVEADVDLPGFVANPYPAMRAAAVLALTSRFDALPGVLIEALALGTPIVATDCPSGPAEILRGGLYGHLVPVGVPKAIAAALLRVLGGRSAGRPADPEWLDPFLEDTAMGRYVEILLDAAKRA